MILGPVGVGKTFLATALGHIAGRRGRSVHFERAGARLRSVPMVHETVAAESADRLVADDEAHAVRLAFARLPDDDRELLGLRVVAHLDSETTAQILGKRPGAVRMARALRRLRVALDEADRER